LAIIFDYTLKFSGLKIPFPWMPFLKFDFTGIPIVMSLLLFDVASGATTSLVAALGIIARSGDLLGGAMKGIAEFSTVIGVYGGIYLANKLSLSKGVVRGASLVMGIIVRVLVMTALNLVVLPRFYGIPFNVVVGMLTLLAVFNGIQGSITILVGFFLHGVYEKRTNI
jgi:riboflavin transporter FmnP